MNLNGYNETTDTGSEVFLGFINGSLNFLTETDYSTYTYGSFACTFYYYLVNLDYSVKNALNYAAIDTIGSTFSSADLYTGYDLIIPPFEYPFKCRLAIYGNGDLTLP